MLWGIWSQSAEGRALSRHHPPPVPGPPEEDPTSGAISSEHTPLAATHLHQRQALEDELHPGRPPGGALGEGLILGGALLIVVDDAAELTVIGRSG